jgi:hypothetical protein
MRTSFMAPVNVKKKNGAYTRFSLIKVKYNGKQQSVESETEENRENPQDNRLPSRDLNMGLPVY